MTWIASYAVPATVVILAIISSFRKRDRAELLRIILFSYFAIMVSFAGLYYSITVVGDYNDAVSKYIFYRYEKIRKDAGLSLEIVPAADKRPFRGMEHRLWSGVDWPIFDDGSPNVAGTRIIFL